MTYSTADVVVLVDSWALPLAPLPVTTPVDGSSILLDASTRTSPKAGPSRSQASAPTWPESRRRASTSSRASPWRNSLTRLDLETALPWPLNHPSLRIDANLAKATHGESVSRPIGHGSASLPGQRFRLPVAPLTHVAAPTTSGVAPELEVRVDGVVWTRLDSLRTAGPLDRVYTLTYREGGRSSLSPGTACTAGGPARDRQRRRHVARGARVQQGWCAPASCRCSPTSRRESGR